MAEENKEVKEEVEEVVKKEVKPMANWKVLTGVGAFFLIIILSDSRLADWVDYWGWVAFTDPLGLIWYLLNKFVFPVLGLAMVGAFFYYAIRVGSQVNREDDKDKDE